MKPKLLFTTLATVASLAMSPALAQTVFIPEGSANSVLMVDGTTGATIRRIDGLEAVHGLAGAPGVPVLVAGSFAEVDRAEAKAADKPAGVSADAHADHHAAPVQPMGPKDAGISLLSVLDAETGDILRRIEVPGAVHHTAVSPDGRYAVATHPAGGGISIIDLNRNELTAFVATGPMPNYAVFGTDPARVYVSNAGNGTVSEVDLVHGIVRRNLLAGKAPEHLTLDTEAGTLYVAEPDAGRVLELLLATGEVRRTFEIGGLIHGLDLSDNRMRLVVAGRGENKLTAIELKTGAMSAADLAPQPYHVTTIPAAGRLFVSSRAEPKIWIVDASDLSVVGEFPVSDIGHQMVVLK